MIEDARAGTRRLRTKAFASSGGSALEFPNVLSI